MNNKEFHVLFRKSRHPSEGGQVNGTYILSFCILAMLVSHNKHQEQKRRERSQ